MSHVAELSLFLFSVNLGLAFGGGLYESRIIVPLWFEKTGTTYRVNTTMMRRLDVGRQFWSFITTVPLTLLTLANLTMVWQATGPQRTWWLAATLTTLAERIGTFAFFIPIAIKLERSDAVPVIDASGLAKRWIGANYVRSALNLIGWLLTIQSIAVYT